jgi:hypothetical protein
MATKIVNGVEVTMSAAEEAEFETERAPTLPQAKRLMRERIAKRRVLAEISGFTHLTTRYNSDVLSLARIANLADRARTAQANSTPFNISVIAQDDTTNPMNAAAYIALQVSLGDHFLACSDNSKTLRQAVNQALDVPAVLAVDTELGWP